MLFPATFISTLEKIGVGLEKQAANSYLHFHPEMDSLVFLFLLFFSAVQNEGIFSYLDYELLI